MYGFAQSMLRVVMIRSITKKNNARKQESILGVLPSVQIEFAGRHRGAGENI